MEIFWLISTIFFTGLAAYIVYRKGFEEGYYILSLPFVAGVMYAMRRWFRKRMEREEKERQRP